MKNKINIMVATCCIILVGYSALTVFIDTDIKDNDIEKQLQVILDSYKWEKWRSQDGVYEMWAVTDLDQNGRLELIYSRLEGSGQYTYSDYYEVSESYDGLTICQQLNRNESEADIMVDAVPVYYDSDNNIFYYIFDDVLRDGIKWGFKNKRSVSLSNGELSERILAYKTIHYIDDLCDSTAIITCKDASGNEIYENKYSNIADFVFSDFIKKEACFSWFYLDRLDIDTSELAAKLRRSYNGFLIK